ncbi:methyl-accepting chemotaxis protein [Aliikangiella sp. IMCC44359]|uniref:methyl-accepting chemotaxis protein n=1 Tax=Aliikangiella sp. IMCC44359 TaxID=3459125 RepID=UPI00403ABF52
MKQLQFKYKLIILSSVLLVIVLSAFAFNNYLLLKKQTESNLSVAIDQISTSISTTIADWLNAKSSIAQSIANSAAEDLSKEAVYRVIAQGQQTGELKNTYVGTEEKNFILDDKSTVLPDDYDPTQRPWYIAAKQKGGISYTKPYIDATTHQLVISVAAPIYKNSQFLGVAGIDMQMADIINIVNRVDYLGLGYAFLLSYEGDVLSHPEKKWIGKNLTDIFNQPVKLTNELTEYKINGKEKLVAFFKVDGIEEVNWYLSVVLDKQKAYTPLYQLKNQSFIYGITGVITTIVIMGFLLNILMKPVQKLNEAIKDIAQGKGDLTQRLEVYNEDEIGQLSIYFNLFIEKIHQSMTDVNKASELLKQNISKVREIVTLTQSLFNQQNSLTCNVNESVAQLNTASNEISKNAQRASELASNIHQLSLQSREVLDKNIKSVHLLSQNVNESGLRIKDLNLSTENIGAILEVIRTVSEQTNLLSLNAAIEAARAGEQGRGFAVVADEVRQLAHRTSDSTTEIHDMIQNLQQGVLSVGQSMLENTSQSEICEASANDADKKMESIMVASNDIDGENQSVASATEEQNHVINHINNDIITLTTLNEKGALNLTQITEECDLLQNQFNELNTLVSQFKL